MHTQKLGSTVVTCICLGAATMYTLSSIFVQSSLLLRDWALDAVGMPSTFEEGGDPPFSFCAQQSQVQMSLRGWCAGVMGMVSAVNGQTAHHRNQQRPHAGAPFGTR